LTAGTKRALNAGNQETGFRLFFAIEAADPLQPRRERFGIAVKKDFPRLMIFERHGQGKHRAR
jgi:hypothetical protein